jgi:hypothetical protein
MRSNTNIAVELRKHQPCRLTSHLNARAPETIVSPTVADWVPAYLAALEESLGQKIKAAKAAGVTPRTVQRRRATDEAFAREERDRMEVVKDLVESEITRRAIEGVTRKRYDRNGKLISEEIDYSDALLLRLAERTETGSWRQKQQIEHSEGLVFKTRAERKRALEQAKLAIGSVRPKTGKSNALDKSAWRASGVADGSKSREKRRSFHR